MIFWLNLILNSDSATLSISKGELHVVREAHNNRSVAHRPTQKLISKDKNVMNKMQDDVLDEHIVNQSDKINFDGYYIE